MNADDSAVRQVIGFVAIVFPIMAACLIIRFVMADLDPLGYLGIMGICLDL